MTREQALQTLANYVGPALAAQQQATRPPDIVAWAHTNYYIPELAYPIRLENHQQTFLRWAANSGMSSLLYSTVKKSGKTAISGLFSRYRAEYSGNNAEIYFVANDREQAKDRAYVAALNSIERTPGYNHGKRELPGQWRIIEKRATHLPTGSFMQALAGDYEGAAGSNPTLTAWTELWGFTTERFIRLWDELTPVPTRERSERLVETYAGFVDESILLYNLYRTAVRNAHRLTRDELTRYAGNHQDPWPFPDDPPFYINEAANTFAYWDEGPAAQARMPWQVTPRGKAYYVEHERTDRPEAYQRLHLNYWVSSAQAFIQPAWWVACKQPLAKPLPKDWPIVVAVDGSVNSDCTAVVGVAREPVYNPTTTKLEASDTDVRVVFARVFEPPKGGVIDLDSVEALLRHVCGYGATIQPKWPDREYHLQFADMPIYNVAQITYDAYQLHQCMTTLQHDFIAWTKPFSQAGEREIADKQLYDLIIRKQIRHNDEYDPQFMYNAAAYVAGENAKNQDRLRLVKKAPDMKIDPVVCTSMGARICLYLLLS